MAQMKLFAAGAPELVRCNQKDRFYTDHLTSLLSDLFRQTLPLRLWLRWQRELQLVAELSYHGFTTVLGNQTLGEEYCNIIQVGPSNPVDGRYAVAGFVRRLVPVIVQTVGVYAVEKALEVVYRRIRDRDLLSLQLSAREYELLERIVGYLEDVVSGASRLHLALFYLHGLFYHVGKRLASVKYLMVRYNMAMAQEPSSLHTYRVLGWLILIQLGIQALKVCYNVARRKESQRDEAKDRLQIISEDVEEARDGGMRITWQTPAMDAASQFKCPLCLELCSSQTSTVCGHIFCWVCISEWTSEKAECPVCRTTVQPQQLVCLQHFNI